MMTISNNSLKYNKNYSFKPFFAFANIWTLFLSVKHEFE